MSYNPLSPSCPDDPARTAPPADWKPGEEARQKEIFDAHFYNTKRTIEACVAGEADSALVLCQGLIQRLDAGDIADLLGELRPSSVLAKLWAYEEKDIGAEAEVLKTELISELATLTANYLTELDMEVMA